MFTIWRHQLLCGQVLILGKLLLNHFSRSAFGHFNAEYFEILEAKPHKSVFVLKVGRRCNGMTVALVGNKYWHYICRRGGPDGIVHKMLITGRVQDMLIGVSITWGCNTVQYGAIRYWYKMLVTGKMQDMLIGPLHFAVLSPQRWYNMVWAQAQYVEGTIWYIMLHYGVWVLTMWHTMVLL